MCKYLNYETNANIINQLNILIHFLYQMTLVLMNPHRLGT